MWPKQLELNINSDKSHAKHHMNSSFIFWAVRWRYNEDTCYFFFIIKNEKKMQLQHKKYSQNFKQSLVSKASCEVRKMNKDLHKKPPRMLEVSFS